MNLAFNLENPKLTEKELLLHEKALLKAKNFKKAHAELLEIVIEVDEARLYEKFSLTSTFSYCLTILNLSKDVTCILTKVARASQNFPELKEAIAADEIHMSNARQIGHLLTASNKSEWIEKAKTLTQEGLQKEIVKQFPKEAVYEKAKYVAENRIKLEVGLDEETMELIKWAQDFVSQKTKSAANYEKTLKEVLTEYKERNDPLAKAERAEKRKSAKQTEAKTKTKIKIETKAATDVGTGSETEIRTGADADNGPSVTNQLRVARLQRPQVLQPPKRKPIPAEIIHKINLRDKRQCQALLQDGKKCESTRWVDYHHIAEVRYGGTNTLENLTTLCSRHHRMLHRE